MDDEKMNTLKHSVILERSTIGSGVIYARRSELLKKETWNPIRHVRSRAFLLGAKNAQVLERIYHKGHAEAGMAKKSEIPA